MDKTESIERYLNRSTMNRKKTAILEKCNHIKEGENDEKIYQKYI